MPFRLFWAYLVGVALLAASLSIATKIQVFWSGLLFGSMMFLFVLMSDFPGALANPRDRFGWTFVLRELSFAAGGWLLAASAMRSPHRNKLLTVGRIILGVAAIFYGVEHFLHPLRCPGVPLEKIMPTYIPLRPVIGVITGAILVIAGAAILLNRKTRVAATWLRVMDCAAGRICLWANSDRAIARSQRRSSGGGHQLLRGYAAVRRRHSRLSPPPRHMNVSGPSTARSCCG